MCADTAQIFDRMSSGDRAAPKPARLDRRPVRVVELRFFGGLTEHKVVGVLGVTRRAVRNDRGMACAWLRCELEGKREVAA